MAAALGRHAGRAHLRTSPDQDQRQQTHHDWVQLSTLAFAPDEPKPTSWALPVLHQRIRPTETPIEKAAGQLRSVCALLPERPVVLLDSEYGCAAFVKATSDATADKIMRLRPNRCLFGSPPPYCGRGRPPIHGHKFKLNDPQTWPEPDEVLELAACRRSPL